MTDALLLALTAGISWRMWAALETWGDVAMAWMWGCGMWIVREMRAM